VPRSGKIEGITKGKNAKRYNTFDTYTYNYNIFRKNTTNHENVKRSSWFRWTQRFKWAEKKKG